MTELKLIELKKEECPHSNQTKSNGFFVCTVCGECLEQTYIDEEPSFKNDQNISHAAVTSGFFGDHTTFHPSDADGVNRALFIRLRRTKERRNSYERKMAYASVFLKQLVEQCELPVPPAIYVNIMTFLGRVFKIIKYRVLNHLIIAGMCIACRDAGISLSVKGIAERFGRLRELTNREILEFRKAITASITQILKVLDIGFMPSIHKQIASTILAKLDISQAMQPKVYELLQRLDTINLSGKDKRGTVAAIIYVTTGATQREISMAANVCEVTIRQRVKFLRKEHLIEEKEENE